MEGHEEGTGDCRMWLRGFRAGRLGRWPSRDREDRRVVRCYGRVMSLFWDLAISRNCDASTVHAVKAVGGRGLEFGWQTRKEDL